MTTDIHELVRERYAQSALTVLDQGTEASCCGDGCCTGAGCADPSHAGAGVTFYSELERADLPEDAVLASLGCGNPLAVAELRDGETVLDLGSGGGIDVLLSAKRVGPTGRAIGLDMTDEMLTLARRNAAEAGATNVEFLKGHIEAIPLPAGSIDVVISNCVVNLAADKPAVFAEIARVLRPGGRIGITDIVADDALTPAERAERGSYTGCIAGALSVSEFTQGLTDAGLADVSLTPTHEAAPGMYSAIIRASKPA
jgi:SAM-dependent methyltransferase